MIENAIPFMCQINRFVARNPDHPVVVAYNNGSIGLGYIVRHWQEIQNEDIPNQWEGPIRENDLSQYHS